MKLSQGLDTFQYVMYGINAIVLGVICFLINYTTKFIFEKRSKEFGIYALLGIKKGKIKEVIIAVKPTIEGETTSLYISKILEGIGVKITKIAHGVPLGTDMEYIDSLTLELAIADRTEI